MKKLIVLVLMLAMLWFVGACEQVRTPETGTGQVKIAIEIPLQLLDYGEITLEEIAVTISKGEEEFTKIVPVEGSVVEVVFDSLAPGDWAVLAEGYEEGFMVYKGTGQGTVTAGTTTTVDIVMELNTGNLEVTVLFPELNSPSGEVYLDNIDTELVGELVIDGNSGKATFADLQARTWEGTLELRAGEEIVWGKEDGVFLIDVYPGKTTQAEIIIDLEQGNLVINVTWNIPISQPIDFTGIYTGEQVELTWDHTEPDRVLGYRIFRADNQVKYSLNPTLTEESSFVDAEVEPGKEYSYWVLVYATDGTSRLSEKATIKTEDPEPPGEDTAKIFGEVKLQHEWPTPDYGTWTQIDFAEPKETEYIEGQVIIGFDPTKINTLNLGKAKVIDTAPRAVLLNVPEGEEDYVIADLLSQGVRYAEKNAILHTHATIPNDPLYENQWHYPNIRLPQTWTVETGSKNTRIAVLDTGIDATHPDLAGQIDVENGWNFVSDNDDTHDRHGHGTHVAGTIGALTNNSVGVAGVMWDVSILPVKVLSDSGTGSAWGVGMGMLYAAGLTADPVNSAPVDAMNLSLGGSSTMSFVEECAQEVYDAGVLMICSAGNSGGSIGYPAYYDTTISVGATGWNYPNEPIITSYSSWSPLERLDVVAPGGTSGYPVLSTVPGGYAGATGTSMAAPHVTGLVGLMISAGIPRGEVLTNLKETAMVIMEGASPSGPHDLLFVNSYFATTDTKVIKIYLENTEHSILVSLQADNYELSNLPAGAYTLTAHVDVSGNNNPDRGDYIVSHEVTVGAGELLELDLILTELR